MNEQEIINNKVDKSEIHKVLKMAEIAFEGGKIQEVLSVLIPVQKKLEICFNIDELGLLKLSKSSCVELANTYLNSELHTQAKIIYEFILKYFPEDNDIQKKYSISLLADAEDKIINMAYDEARLLLNEMIKKNEKNVSAMIDLGVINILEQKYVEAKTIFQNVLAIEPDNEVALENIQVIIQKTNEK